MSIISLDIIQLFQTVAVFVPHQWLASHQCMLEKHFNAVPKQKECEQHISRAAGATLLLHVWNCTECLEVLRTQYTTTVVTRVQHSKRKPGA